MLAVMVTAVPIGLLTIIRIIAPGWPWLAIAVLGLLTAVQALSTTIWLRQHEQLGLNKPTYRAAEFMVIIILTRLFAWGINGNWPQIAQWRSYLIEPSLLFDGYFVVALLVLFLIWNWSITLTTIFHHLEISSAERNYYDRSHPSNDRPMPPNRVRLTERFFQHWLWGGIFLIVCAALTTYDLAEIEQAQNPLAIGRLGLRPEILVATIAYFLSGFWLLSQARLSVMKAQWLTGRVVKQEPVERSWRRTSFMTLLIIAALATLLPIGSTLMISRIINTLIVSLVFLLNFIAFIFSALFFSLLSLIGRQPPGAEVNDPIVMPQPLPPPIGETAVPSDAPSLIAGSIFWLIVFGFAIIAFIFFLRERGYRLPSWQQIWHNLRRWWQKWWHGLATQVAKIQRQTLTRTDQESKRPLRAPWRFLRLNALSPREQIHYFYLSTIRRAGGRGIPRQQNETPLEYADSLRQELPDTTADVNDLTQAFLQARYSPQPIDTGEATAVKPIWKRLRTAIKQKRKRAR